MFKKKRMYCKKRLMQRYEHYRTMRLVLFLVHENLKMKMRYTIDHMFAFAIKEMARRKMMADSRNSCIPLYQLILYFLSTASFKIFNN
jgi:hypothetical protein